MSEKLRNLVREVESGDLSAPVLARIFHQMAREGGGEPLDKIWGDGYDTGEVFKYAESWGEEDVDVVLWEQEGYNDGDEWAALCLLKDGRYGWVEAGCDYTGWG